MSQSESDVRNKFFPQLEKCRGSLKEGDYPEAEKECSKAVDISNDLPKNVVLERSTARSLLGHSLFRQRRVREAIPVYVEALHLDESYLKADDADLATDYANVARAFAAVGGELTKADVFYAQAVKTFEAAIQSLPSMKENYTKRLIRTLDEYAQIKEALGQSGAANELHRKADALSR
jgi:tetratricopeptide (TPR) repeat protein